MAGDWIKLEHVTPGKPEVDRIAEAMNLPADQVVGILVRVWIWADQQTLDGDAAGVTARALERQAGVTGFAGAMREAGWLEVRDDGLRFPNFDRHNGETAKQRALTAKRNTRYRRRERDGASVTQTSPEKRREEYIYERTSERCDVDFSEIDWQQVKLIADRQVPALKTASVPFHTNQANRRLVLVACALVHAGVLPEDWLVMAIGEVADAGDEVKRPAALLTDRLKAGAKRHRLDFAAVRRRIKVPKELLQQKRKKG